MKTRHFFLWVLLLPVAGCCDLMGICSDPCEEDPTAAECQPTYTPTQALLSIQPIAQQTEVWCWAASAEMVFRHYGLPNVNPGGNYQCGVVGVYAYVLGGPTHACVYDCGLCVEPIATLTELQRVIDTYGIVAQQAGFASRVLTSKSLFAPLTLNQLAKELDEGRPIIAGVSFRGIRLPNISQHAVVIVGYDARGGEPLLYVNDPYPYNNVFAPQLNPYLASGGTLISPGRYSISLSTFTNNLVWGNTLYEIH